MKVKDLFKSTLLLLCAILVFSCSNNEEDILPIPTDDRSIIMSSNVDIDANSNGTAKLTVIGRYDEGSGNANAVKRKGIVYGTNPLINVDSGYIVLIEEPGDIITTSIDNVFRNTTYYVRGFFEMSDGSFFYSNEVQAITNVVIDRSIKLELINPGPIDILPNGVALNANVSAIENEFPVEIGIELGFSEDFSIAISLEAETQIDENLNSFSKEISNLVSGITYYFRPYAKYADGTVSYGGSKVLSLTL